MNKTVLAFAAVLLIGASVFLTRTSSDVAASSSTSNEPLSALFQDWKVKNNKQYASVEEEMYRFQVFVDTKEWIDANNGGSAVYALNFLSDLTKEEFTSMYLGTSPSPREPENEVTFEGFHAPASMNWTALGDVSAVQNQGQCGSCWAFSTAEAVECAYAVFKGVTGLLLSEEQLVQCAKFPAYLNFGCNGGQMTQGFAYVKKTPLATQAQYPYTSEKGVTGNCDKSAEGLGSFGITGYKTVAPGCSNLQAAIAQQPISVAVDASNWSSYSSGIMSDCGTNLNHGVLATGYLAGSYFLVKNSWSAAWGMDGYIQVDFNNGCGICNQPAFPTL